LFTPATKPERFTKAVEIGADVLIIDLEDSVAPDDKDRARATALEYLNGIRKPFVTTALRINGLETRAGLADLAAFLDSGANPELLILPKAESLGYVRILDKQLTLAGKTARLIAMIESVRGLAYVKEIARATTRLEALMFGAADMSADLGAETAWEPLLYTRSRLVAACALAGVPALDAPFFDVHDSEGLKQEITRSRALGFSGKCAIHPTQIAAINAALTPTPQAVAQACAILAENAKGVGVVNGQMVDEAIARHARSVLEAANEANQPLKQ
jgi:(S)-citramalyl-CoA lyase